MRRGLVLVLLARARTSSGACTVPDTMTFSCCEDATCARYARSILGTNEMTYEFGCEIFDTDWSKDLSLCD